MQAVILAGGLGTRLRSIVADRPKPMAEFGGRPFLEYLIERLKRHGFTEFVLCVGYLHRHILDHFGDGATRGIAIRYSIETSPLGTGGALRLAAQHLRGPCLALNGDTFCDVDVGELVRSHVDRRTSDARCIGTLALARARDPRDFGTVGLDRHGFVRSFEEKPADAVTAAPTPTPTPTRRAAGRDGDTGDPMGDPTGAGLYVSAGMYVLEPEALELLPSGTRASVETDLFPAILRSGLRLYGHRSESLFIDIGTPRGHRSFLEYIGLGEQDDHP